MGRVLRRGQKKIVHFYQFVAARTIDVNILQARTKKVVVRRAGKFRLEKEEDVVPGDERGWEGARFEGAACNSGDLELD